MRSSTSAKPAPATFIFARVTTAIPWTGFKVGERVYVRRSRSGGWRVLGLREQIVIGDGGIARFVASERSADNVVQMASDRLNDLLDAHLKAVFAGRVLPDAESAFGGVQ